MTKPETMIHLSPSFFSEREQTLVAFDSLVSDTFLFRSGVCGLRLKNDLGQLVLLPFQGQQIWSAEFRGRELTMRSMFGEPRPTRQYLENYGGFLLHCGATTMGAPTSADSHPLHGELPNAPYQEAYLIAGQDEHHVLAPGLLFDPEVVFFIDYESTPCVSPSTPCVSPSTPCVSPSTPCVSPPTRKAGREHAPRVSIVFKSTRMAAQISYGTAPINWMSKQSLLQVCAGSAVRQTRMPVPYMARVSCFPRQPSQKDILPRKPRATRAPYRSAVRGLQNPSCWRALPRENAKRFS